jgi:hypothetical protein
MEENMRFAARDDIGNVSAWAAVTILYFRHIYTHTYVYYSMYRMHSIVRVHILQGIHSHKSVYVQLHRYLITEYMYRYLCTVYA